MLNIIHRLKSGISPAFFLTSVNVLAQPLIIPTGHWQEEMIVGVTEFSGTLYVPNVSWQWQPRSMQIAASDAVQTGKSGMKIENVAEQEFYILGGHTSSLTTARPGLQPSVTLLQVSASSPHIIAKGECFLGKVCYGEITFRIHHLLASQDVSMADNGWSVLSGEVTPYTEQQIKHQLLQVSDYKWISENSRLTARSNIFISGTEPLLPQKKEEQYIAGAWVTSLSHVRVKFSDTKEKVKRWQGSLIPVVMYF
ncbi:fimbrial protein [Escherichia coli]|uniref:fimbrial protein n=1 Tax=Escherichia coli TaxID=562 RepID=UPI000DE84DBD|nr:fimbrial protein [Escherichia coli]RBQ41302.1 fimbrial protein [Escherichia coli]